MIFAMNIAILTSVDTRHRYFVQAMRRFANVAAVVYEETGYSPADTTGYDLSPAEERVVAEHFAERQRQETLFFGHDAEFVVDGRDARVLRVTKRELNAPATANFVASVEPDVVLVYGTDLIKPPLLDRFAGRMLNLHLGLSPYYRGTATNFYPLLNEEPEYVGATIHLIDPGIDTGPIFAHARPSIVIDDQPHTIGCKTILAGIQALGEVLARWHSDRPGAVPQWPVPNPRLYLRKDYHPRQVVELYRKLEAGMIPRYVKEERERAARVKLVVP